MSAPDRAIGPAALAVALTALVARVAVITRWPDPYAFDAYQRWAGREHLLVKDWLPATQAVIWAVAGLGGGVEAARLALAAVAAVGVGATAVVAGRLGGARAAWLTLPLALFGPLTVWSATLYQEGTYLALAMGALALLLSGRERAADVLVGALALVRYEGWACVALWVAWRGDRRAAVALWGAVGWLVVKAAGAEGHDASPVDYSDWAGIPARFALDRWAGDVARVAGHAVDSGAWVFLGLGAAGMALGWRTPAVRLLAGWSLVQGAATLGWIAGLEAGTRRMVALPAALAAVPAALVAARARPGWLVAALAAGLGLWGAWDALDAAAEETRRSRPEREAVARMAAVGGARWWIEPRTGLGTRARHDGCEMIQGLSELRHGEDFWCAAWGDTRPEGTRAVRWDGRAYRVE